MQEDFADELSHSISLSALEDCLVQIGISASPSSRSAAHL
jgi:hypothetical protein